ncbi:MAG: hypothetical protein EBT92_06650 [Planctomycetes bacterium]|nr:hypothetical protein [Planctomycetota bacterium]
MMPYPLLIFLMNCFLFQTTDENTIVSALSTPEGVTASIQVKLLEEKLPGAVFSILLKIETTREIVFSQFNLDEKYKNDWELLPPGNETITKFGNVIEHTIPFILRAKKTGVINIPNLEALVLVDAKEFNLVWKDWLIPEKPFPFKELDTPQKNDDSMITKNSKWIAIGLLFLIALGVLGLIKKEPVSIQSRLNVAKELESWLKKADVITLEECITTLEPILQAEAIATQKVETGKSKSTTSNRRLTFEKALQVLEEIKYSKVKDRSTLILTISELIKTF